MIKFSLPALIILIGMAQSPRSPKKDLQETQGSNTANEQRSSIGQTPPLMFHFPMYSLLHNPNLAARSQILQPLNAGHSTANRFGTLTNKTTVRKSKSPNKDSKSQGPENFAPINDNHNIAQNAQALPKDRQEYTLDLKSLKTKRPNLGHGATIIALDRGRRNDQSRQQEKISIDEKQQKSQETQLSTFEQSNKMQYSRLLEEAQSNLEGFLTTLEAKQHKDLGQVFNLKSEYVKIRGSVENVLNTVRQSMIDGTFEESLDSEVDLTDFSIPFPLNDLSLYASKGLPEVQVVPTERIIVLMELLDYSHCLSRDEKVSFKEAVGAF